MIVWLFSTRIIITVGVELNSFQEDERGELLIEYSTFCHTLHFLVRTNAGGDEDYHRHADLIFLEELIRLYRMDLFKQEDIRYK